MTRIAVAIVAGLLGVAHAGEPLFPVQMNYRLPGPSGYQYQFSGDESRLVPYGEEAQIDVAPPSTFKDCSTPLVDCIVTDRFVFAVPHGTLKAGQRVEVASTEIKVIGCIPASDTRCATAVLESRCLVEADEVRDVCKWEPDVSRMLYIFDSNRGIIAFVGADNWPEITDLSGWRLDSLGTTAGMYALVEPMGLLAKLHKDAS